MLNVPLTPGTLPTNYCFESWQTTLNDFASNLSVNLDNTGASFVLVQNTVPTATQRGSLWFDTRVDRMYRWNSSIGAWLALHPYSASSPVRMLWTSDLTALETFDGGEAGAATTAAGVMWEQDPNYAGRMFIGVGTLPSGSVIALDATGGHDQLTLVQANLPNVQLGVNTAIIGVAGVGSPENVVGNTYGSTAVSGSGRAVDSTSTDQSGRYYTKGQTEALGSGTAVTSISPYRAGYVIKRSVRAYYKAS